MALIGPYLPKATGLAWRTASRRTPSALPVAPPRAMATLFAPRFSAEARQIASRCCGLHDPQQQAAWCVFSVSGTTPGGRSLIAVQGERRAYAFNTQGASRPPVEAAARFALRCVRMITALATGAFLGLSCGLAPGPLLALLLAQTLRHGSAAADPPVVVPGGTGWSPFTRWATPAPSPLVPQLFRELLQASFS
jgi:hypothetical protein